MASGDVQNLYGTSVDIDVTNLDLIATSATWIAGWESAVIDNTTDLYEDYLISGVFQVHSGAVTANTEIRVYVFAMTSDTTYPDLMDGTEGTDAWSTAQARDANATLLAVCQVPVVTADLFYSFTQRPVANCFGGVCPPKFGIFVTQNTGQNLGATQVVTIQGFRKHIVP